MPARSPNRKLVTCSALVAFKLFASLLPTAISERRADFNTPRKSTNPLKTKAYEKTNNINRYRQYRCGPGINIRMRDYQRRRGCSKPSGAHNASDYYDD